MRLSVVVSVALASGLSGCFTSERLGRPPSPGEVAKINDAIRQGRSLVVEYTTTANLPGARRLPRAACVAGPCPSPPVEPLCTTAACAQIPVGVGDPASAQSADAFAITLGLMNGGRATLPLDWVSSLKVTGYGRGRGAVIGASIGAGGAASVLTAFILALRGANTNPGLPGQTHGCDTKCGTLLGLVALQGALLGGIIGAAIGTPHYFRFGDAPLTTAP